MADPPYTCRMLAAPSKLPPPDGAASHRPSSSHRAGPAVPGSRILTFRSPDALRRHASRTPVRTARAIRPGTEDPESMALPGAGSRLLASPLRHGLTPGPLAPRPAVTARGRAIRRRRAPSHSRSSVAPVRASSCRSPTRRPRPPRPRRRSRSRAQSCLPAVPPSPSTALPS